MPNPSTSSPGADADTPRRLLDAAERLFAELGYDGVGMRMLTDAAATNLGAVTYHFGTKAELYVETLLRRLKPMNELRRRQLDAVELAHPDGNFPLETLLDCWLREPFMTTQAHPYFLKLLARSIFMPPPFLMKELAKEMGPFDQRIVAHLIRLRPHIPPPDLLQLLHFCMGALFFSVAAPVSSALRASPHAAETALQNLIQFGVAGISARTARTPARPPLRQRR
jgi:AcrR family transcriptional regulator